MKGLSWLGIITGVLVLASGWEGFVHFPEVFMGPAAERALEERVEFLWPRWTFPVSAPMLVMLTVTVLTAWMAHTSKTDWVVGGMAVVFALATVLVPLTFIHQSLTGPPWLRVPHWYWIWTMLFGALCSVWFGFRIVSDDRPNRSLE